MAVTPLTNLVGLGHNVAYDVSLNGQTADTANFNSVGNNGRLALIITTGATPGTVSVVVTRTVDGKVVADYSILDSAGAALGANKTYLVGVGAPSDYGDTLTIKATQATTKILPIQVGF
jgi:hypothetical protein